MMSSRRSVGKAMSVSTLRCKTESNEATEVPGRDADEYADAYRRQYRDKATESEMRLP